MKGAARMAEGDEVARRMLESVSPSIDPERTRKTIFAALEALEKQANVLRDADYSHEVYCKECKTLVRVAPSAKEVGQAAAYTAKVVDEIYRLTEFAQGRADSRPDMGQAGLLEYLTDDQLNLLTSWVEQGKAKSTPMPKGATIQ